MAGEVESIDEGLSNNKDSLGDDDNNSENVMNQDTAHSPTHNSQTEEENQEAADSPTHGSQVDDETQEEEGGEKKSKLPLTHERLIKLPLSRIKVIMKTDPDVTLASQEAVVAIAKATELFIAGLSNDAVASTLNSKRKTLQRKDLDSVIDTRDGYEFLEGALD